MIANHVHDGGADYIEWLEVLLFTLLFFIYVLAAVRTSRRRTPWPLHRYICWVMGVFGAAVAVIGPYSHQADGDFSTHMIGHLLLGMLTPILISLAAPMTLLLRALHVRSSRRIVVLLKSRPIRFISDPIAASIFNVGGLWIVYTTSLYSYMQQSLFLHHLVNVHVFLAGYVFTQSIVSVDPAPHSRAFMYKAGALIVGLAAHSILSKHIFAYPPTGVSSDQAKSGALIMYYGGDAIDIVLIFLLCWQWYKAARPKLQYIRPYKYE